VRAQASLFRRFTNTIVYVTSSVEINGKLATKYPWVCGYFYSVNRSHGALTHRDRIDGDSRLVVGVVCDVDRQLILISVIRVSDWKEQVDSTVPFGVDWPCGCNDGAVRGELVKINTAGAGRQVQPPGESF